MKISVIIPCYNQQQWLPEAIESVLKQTIRPHEVIVVNDGGEKFTVPEGIKLIEQENKGLAGARNIGIEHSTGDYICCLDADDTLPSDYLAQLSTVNADIVGCGYKTFGDYEIVWKSRGTITLEDMLDGNRTQCSALFKKEVWEKVGGFDTQMKIWEDWLFWMEALAHGFSMVCTDKTYLNYRKHGQSMISGTDKYAKESKEYMEKKLLKLFSGLENSKSK